MKETIHLSPQQFVNAITMGGALDINHVDRNFEVRNEFGGDSTIYIRNVKVNSIINLIGKTISSKIVIEDCLFLGIHISDCTFLKEVCFDKIVCNSFWFSRTKVNYHFDIKHSKITTLNFNYSESPYLALSKVTSYSIDIAHCVIENIGIYRNEIESRLTISNCTKTKRITIDNTSALNIDVTTCQIDERIEVVNTEALQSFYLSGNIEGTVLLYNVKLSKLSSKYFAWGREQEYLIKQSKILNITLPTVKDKRSLMLHEVEFNYIELRDFNNLGYMQWSSLNPVDKSKISIYGSNTGKWDLIGCDFSQIKLSINRSKILDSFYTNTLFPSELSLPTDIDTNDREMVHSSLRDAYNQLKTIAQKQNDRRYYLHFQAAEMASYYETVSWLWPSTFNKVQLWLMKYSNNFGINWQLGVLFVILTNLFF